MQTKKPYRVIIRSNNEKAIKKAIAKLITEFKGDSELRISKIHRG